MTFKTRLTTAIATGAVLLNAIAPMAFAADSTTVTGNGAFSNNTVNSTSVSSTSVNQTNNATVTNSVTSNASTGNNTSSFNTGGDTTVKTGNATNNVGVDNALNLNSASVDCGCISGAGTNVTIKDNGAFSNNTANVTNVNSVSLGQNNVANVTNSVAANSSTGNNSAGFNTGGTTTVWTGDASSNVGVSTKANANFATVGGGLGSGLGSGSSVTIAGNGAYSNNAAALANVSAVVLSQTNTALVTNSVTANATSGNNDASFNTAGNTVVKTGNAKTNVGIVNLLNFNSADVDCGCLLDSTALKIGENGAFSVNRVSDVDQNAVLLGQGNLALLVNALSGDTDTGGNNSAFNGGSAGDPVVWTGNAESTTGVSNTGNVNVVGQGTTLTLPGNLNLVLNFSLSGLWGLFPWAV